MTSSLPPFQIGVRDDLVETGQWTEDCEREIARCFYLVARARDGAQWRHDHSMIVFRVNEDRAALRMERLCAQVTEHVAAGGRLDPNHWEPMDPAYGSEAYADLDAVGYFAAAERQRDRDRGESVPVTMADAALVFGIGPREL